MTLTWPAARPSPRPSAGRPVTALWISALVLWPACRSAPPEDPVEVALPFDPTAGAAPPKWKQCPAKLGMTEASCGSAYLPVDWQDPEGDKMKIFVARITATTPRRGQLWMLQGGPGGAGSELYWVASGFAKLLPDLDIYLPDHRGTGQSTRLGCSKAEALSSPSGAGITWGEISSCREQLADYWGDKLRHFNVTNATRDLAALIELTREQGDEVLVWGASYGTYWGHRLLQVHPEPITGVVLDSVCPPQGCDLSEYDANHDKVARDYLKACAADPFCRSKAGDNPAQKLLDLKAKLAAGHCAAVGAGLTDWDNLRGIVAWLMRTRMLRAAALGIIERLTRCDLTDVASLNGLLELIDPQDDQGGGGRPEFSSALNFHIGLSEMWFGDKPTLEAMLAAYDNMIAAPGAWQMFQLIDVWPTYVRDAFVGAWAQTTVPILLLTGTLDPQTPQFMAELAAKNLAGPNTWLHVFPGAGHGVFMETPMLKATEMPCGLAMTISFLADPHTAPSDACKAGLAPLEFDLHPDLAVDLFGGPLWGLPGKADAVAAPAPPSPWLPRPWPPWSRPGRAVLPLR